MGGATVTNNQANFTTSGQYVNLPSGLFGSYTAVSVETWVTTGVNTGCARIFQFGTSETSNENSLIVSIDASSEIIFMTYVGSHSSHYSSVPFDSQTNLHVVMTVSEGAYASVYTNGVLQGATPVAVNRIPPPNAFFIGKSSVSDPGLIGSVNEFRIWGGALSAADIATRYSQGPGKV